MLHQEINAMLLGCDRVLCADDLHTLQVTDIDLDTAGHARRSLVGAHRAPDNERRLPRQMPGGLKDLLTDGLLKDDALDDTRAIAHLQELQAALARPGIEPAFDRHFLADGVGEMFDANLVSHAVVSPVESLSSVPACANWACQTSPRTRRPIISQLARFGQRYPEN